MIVPLFNDSPTNNEGSRSIPTTPKAGFLIRSKLNYQDIQNIKEELLELFVETAMERRGEHIDDLKKNNETEEKINDIKKSYDIKRKRSTGQFKTYFSMSAEMSETVEEIRSEMEKFIIDFKYL